MSTLAITGWLLTPAGAPVAGSLTLSWGAERPLSVPLSASGGFRFEVGRGKKALELPASLGLAIEGRPLMLPRGMGTMLQDGGEAWDLGVIVYYEAGFELLSPRGLWYGLPAAPADALRRPVLQKAKGLGEVLTDAGVQIESATRGLASGSYSLSSVQITLKGAATEDGFAFLAEDALSTVDVGHLSEISAGYIPVDGSGGGVRSGGVGFVPEVLGYTRALAQRKLAVAGLIPEFSAQTVAQSKGAQGVGRVVAQDPAPGTELPRGSSVRVFLGKAAPPAPNARVATREPVAKPATKPAKTPTKPPTTTTLATPPAKTPATKA